MHSYRTISLIRTSRQEARAKELDEHALASREVESPEPRGLTDSHTEIRGVLELFSNPLHKFAKEQGRHILVLGPWCLVLGPLEPRIPNPEPTRLLSTSYAVFC